MEHKMSNLKEKKQELCYEFEQSKLVILTIPKIYKKRQGEEVLENGNLFVYSKVPNKERAGAGYLINKNLVNRAFRKDTCSRTEHRRRSNNSYSSLWYKR